MSADARRDDVGPMTAQDTARVGQLEEIGETRRSTSENAELQGLYLHRWLWKKLQQAARAVVKSVTR